MQTNFSSEGNRLLINDENRRSFDKQLHFIILAMAIFCGASSAFLMWGHLAGQWWPIRLALTAIYVGAVEFTFITLTRGLKSIFETGRETAIAWAGLLLLVGVIVCNVLTHYTTGVIGWTMPEILHKWLTWGLVLVPIFTMLLSIALRFASPEIRRERTERRNLGAQRELIIESQLDARRSESFLSTKAEIRETLGQLEAMRLRDGVRASLPDHLRAEFDRLMIKKDRQSNSLGFGAAFAQDDDDPKAARR